ncbi:poly(A) polymerase [Psychromonas sp. CNPT3]|uniref:polynucleotide adenylyltransferase PcnB n=1 Tax=Psychromonas sp. CNPT3 TaxID=314282 RepID=UPI00006E78F1|nr:polynucleotide adenylyltransferase PcnB [Psychromonas sp. CNPT3]AGH82100.1 poly(A) polymerase [Psychromonas sp. CNPT3]
MDQYKIPRDKHSISRANIDDNALKVLYRLHNAGFRALLVGGAVRDLLLGLKPKDFDITTNATPEEIKALFRNCRLIGRRFRLAHILFGREVIEVATFRGPHDQQSAQDKQKVKQSQGGMLLRDNVYGSLEEDAERRDFTVNALYYDIADFALYDFCNGMQDLKDRKLTLIGDPDVRYREDPVRMLRAIRFTAKLDLEISPECAEPIRRLANLLQDIPAARHFDEVIKLLLSGQGLQTYRLLKEYKLLQVLFPILFKDGEDDTAHAMIEKALIDTDKRIGQGKRVTPAYIYAVLLWYPVEQRAHAISCEGGMEYHDAFLLAMNEVLSIQVKSIAIPKRFTATIRDIWMLQLRLPRFGGKRAQRVYQHIKFRAAFDFLSLRAHIENDKELHVLVAWWQEYQQENPLPVHQHGRIRINKASEKKPESTSYAHKKRKYKSKKRSASTETPDA